MPGPARPAAPGVGSSCPWAPSQPGGGGGRQVTQLSRRREGSAAMCHACGSQAEQCPTGCAVHILAPGHPPYMHAPPHMPTPNPTTCPPRQPPHVELPRQRLAVVRREGGRRRLDVEVGLKAVHKGGDGGAALGHAVHAHHGHLLGSWGAEGSDQKRRVGDDAGGGSRTVRAGMRSLPRASRTRQSTTLPHRPAAHLAQVCGVVGGVGRRQRIVYLQLLEHWGGGRQGRGQGAGGQGEHRRACCELCGRGRHGGMRPCHPHTTPCIYMPHGIF